MTHDLLDPLREDHKVDRAGELLVECGSGVSAVLIVLTPLAVLALVAFAVAYVVSAQVRGYLPGVLWVALGYGLLAAVGGLALAAGTVVRRHRH